MENGRTYFLVHAFCSPFGSDLSLFQIVYLMELVMKDLVHSDILTAGKVEWQSMKVAGIDLLLDCPTFLPSCLRGIDKRTCWATVTNSGDRGSPELDVGSNL